MQGIERPCTLKYITPWIIIMLGITKLKGKDTFQTSWRNWFVHRPEPYINTNLKTKCYWSKWPLTFQSVQANTYTTYFWPSASGFGNVLFSSHTSRHTFPENKSLFCSVFETAGLKNYSSWKVIKYVFQDLIWIYHLIIFC